MVNFKYLNVVIIFFLLFGKTQETCSRVKRAMPLNSYGSKEKGMSIDDIYPLTSVLNVENVIILNRANSYYIFSFQFMLKSFCSIR